MSIMDFLAIISFGLSCFSIGYTIGKDNHCLLYTSDAADE